MNYFQFLRHPRQAVLCFAALYVFSLAAPVYAQEGKLSDKKVESTITTETADVAAEQVNKDAPKFNAEAVSAATRGNFAASFNRKNEPRFRDYSFSNPNEKKQQSQTGDDDAMMGVMGKGTDSIKLGGHVGFVVPIVARGGGVTTNVGERFVFGFPVGLTVKTEKNLAVDFEFIPTFNTGSDFVLTIHPGIIYGFKKKYAVGVRAAYDAGAGSYGFTPLVSRGFKVNEKVGFFVEADFPIRSNYRAYRDRFGSIAFAMHAGFAF